MIELHGLALSTFCAKVEIVLQLKEVEYTLIAPAGGTYRSEAYQAMVPAATIPALRDGDFWLHDSDSICEYLEDRYPQPSLRPDDIHRRALLRSIARFHDTRLDAAIRPLFPLFSPNTTPDADTVKPHLDLFQLRLGQLERLIDPQPYLNGESLSLADCCFPTTLRMAQRLFDQLQKPVALPDTIARWCDALQAHPVIAGVVDVNQAALSDWLDSS